ncbi:hypothetical protein [Cupriavidus pinatubonensis]|uniref:hypothetical protein n=1 Tax=Cupriavidus pinatubonensis TaxID=248026 RepID=UPI002159DFBB|nr:hypothetical protein [Cupriavidus pinatubonensis]
MSSAEALEISQFAHYNGVMGNVTTPWTDRNVVSYHKGIWADLRRIGSAADFKEAVSFKRRSRPRSGGYQPKSP